MKFVRDIIVNEINAHKLVIGYNHHFGRNREGTFKHLKKYAHVYGFDVEEIPAHIIDNVNISSTKIRQALLLGNVSIAANYLGYNYSLKGEVINGQKIGRTIGFPTANLKVIDESKLIPKDGVYAVHVQIKRKLFKGMMNIGNNPSLTFKKHSIEVHIFDFDSDIYNQQIQVRFIKRIREEISFDNLDSLKIQLEQDKATVEDVLNSDKLDKV